MPLSQNVRSNVNDFFSYETPMYVHIKNQTVGVINRILELIIVGYIIGYAIIYEKGYQEFDDVKSAVSTKVKGIMYANDSRFGPRTFDVADYVIPPRETNAFFITTGIISTMMQTQTNCPEDPYIKGILCQNDTQCAIMKATMKSKGNGPLTGRCVPSSFPGKTKQKVCEIFGWCPVENDNPINMIQYDESVNFTVFIKNNIEFPKFGVLRRNIMDWYQNDSELSNCRWKKDDPRDKYCPIFILGDITKAAGLEYSTLVKTGGILEVLIDWTCNLDYDLDECLPNYSFRRLDRGNYSLSTGFNFRYADHFVMVDERGIHRIYRNLHKVFGIYFLVEVRGTAGKFSIFPLMINIGSGIGLLGIAAVVSDIIVLNFLKARSFYKEKKYQMASTDDPVKESDEVSQKSEGHTNSQYKNISDSRSHLLEEDGDGS